MANSTDAGQLVFNKSEIVSDVNAVNILYVFSILGSLLSAITMCGNLLVIISIVYFKQLHTPTNYLMLSLAVADLLVGLFLLPFSVKIIVTSYWSDQDFLCQLRSSLDIILCSTSISTLCCISVDRYYAVCQPLRYRSKINLRIVGIMVLVSWGVATLTGILFTFRASNQGQVDAKCALFQSKSQASVIVGSILCTFGFPAILMVVLYLKILMVAQRQARSIMKTSKSSTTESKMERKATRTLAIVMGVFLLSWTPFFLCVTFHPVSNYKIPSIVIQLSKWLGWSNSMFNPFVYGFFYRQFRLAFRLIITGKILQENLSNSKLL